MIIPKLTKYALNNFCKSGRQLKSSLLKNTFFSSSVFTKSLNRMQENVGMVNSNITITKKFKSRKIELWIEKNTSRNLNYF